MEELKLLRSYQAWRRFLLLFIPLFCLVSGFTWYICFAEKQTRQKLFHQQEKTCVQNHHQRIMEKLQVIKSDLLFLSLQEEFSDATSTLQGSQRLSLSREFLSFSSTRKEYDQIRFIDLQGLEKIRVNYNNGSPSIVPIDQLQSKAKRYYFIDTLKLDRGAIYLSPFDLNIEHGEIEQPFKPMLRFATLVFNEQDNRIGMIVLNFLGRNILDRLKEELHCDHGCQIMLLNSNGFWLKGPLPENDWAFMFKNRKERTFANYSPAEWQKITTARGEGSFTSEHGYFSFSTIYPLETSEVSSTGHPEPFAESTKRFSGEDYYWKLVTIIPPEVLAIPNSFFFRLFFGYLAVSFIIAIVTFLLAYSQAKRREAETTLQNIFNSSIPICITNADYQIVLSNDSYKNIFGQHSKSPVKCYESRPGPSCHTDACPMRRVLKGEKEVVCEPTKVKADGTIQYFIITARPFLNNKGQSDGIVECFQDVTERKNIETERNKLIGKLQKSLEEIQTLRGILPICSFCKKIRNDEGYYEQIESYFHKHTGVDFSHTFCPTCMKEHYPEEYASIMQKKGE